MNTGLGWARKTSARAAAIASLSLLLIAACTQQAAPTLPAAMAGHSMQPIDAAHAPKAAADARGNLPLVPSLDNGTKVYRLIPQLVRWDLQPGVEVGAFTYNGTVPGPLLSLTPGDRVRVDVENRLSEPTSVHWHGLQIDNAQDGAAGITQAAIQPGATYSYTFVVPNTPGTYFYHSHFQADRQQPLGLYGPLVILDSRSAAVDVDRTIMLGEWTLLKDGNIPAMDMPGMEPNFFSLNGKSYPATETISARVGQRVRLRIIGSGQFIHPMHLHGQPFEITATDGNPVPSGARLVKDTVLVGPGERYDIEFVARAPGKWLFHCHIAHHTTNDGQEEQGAGGLTMIVEIAG